MTVEDMLRGMDKHKYADILCAMSPTSCMNCVYSGGEPVPLLKPCAALRFLEQDATVERIDFLQNILRGVNNDLGGQNQNND